MNKNKIFFGISIVILAISAILFFLSMRPENKNLFKKTSQGPNNCQDVSQLLIELSEAMRKPGAKIDDVENFLFEKCGPCWGIPADQCRE